MAKTVVGLFDSALEAQRVVSDLIHSGFSRSDVSIAANDQRGEHGEVMGRSEYTSADQVAVRQGAEDPVEGAGTGAVEGTLLGGLVGLLVGASVLAIPGIGPVLVAGPLATLLGSAALGAGLGAATGGLVGALVEAGVPETEAGYYAEGVRRGGALVAVSTEDAMVDTAVGVMQRHGVIDLEERTTTWRNEGWDRFDHQAEPYAGAQAMTNAAPPTASALPVMDRPDTGATTTRPTSDIEQTMTSTTMRPTSDVERTTTGTVRPRISEAVIVRPNRSNAPVQIVGDDVQTETNIRDGSPMGAERATTSASMGRGSDDTIAEDWDESSKAGTAGGATAGAVTGAMAGAVGGPVGAVIGGVAGAAVGGGAGAVGDAAGNELEETQRRDASTMGTRSADLRPMDTTPANRTTSTGAGRGSDDTIAEDWDESSKVGTAGGATAGAVTGAMAGAAGGPIGAVIGGVAGAAVGGGAGAVGDAAGNELDEQTEQGGIGGTGTRPVDMSPANRTTTGSEPMRTDTTRVDPAYRPEGSMDQDWEDSSKAGTAGGALAGAATGAAMGSVGGPVGAVIGGAAGALVGGGVGAAGDAAGEALEDEAQRGSVGTTTARRYEDYESDFHTHYNATYGTGDNAYNYYMPGYQYGYNIAQVPENRDRPWEEIEPYAQQNWEQTNPGTWDQFKDAVYYAWTRARGPF